MTTPMLSTAESNLLVGTILVLQLYDICRREPGLGGSVLQVGLCDLMLCGDNGCIILSKG